MSTRAIINVYSNDKSLEARAYSHSDGYPDGLGKALVSFVEGIAKNYEKSFGTRFDDPNYLAARLLVYLSSEFYNHTNYATMLSLGVLPTNKEVDCSQCYEYDIYCSNHGDIKPEIRVTEVGGKSWHLLQNKPKVEVYRDETGRFAKKERVVCFTYYGEFRTLKVTKENDDSFEGIDVHKGAFRRFSKSKMSDIKGL